MAAEDELKTHIETILELSKVLESGTDKNSSQESASLIAIERAVFKAREIVRGQEEQTAAELNDLKLSQDKIRNLKEVIDYHQRYINYCESQHRLDYWIDHANESPQGVSTKEVVQKKLQQEVEERTRTAEELGDLRARAFKLRVRHTDLVKALDSRRITEVAGTLNSKARLVGNILRDIQRDFRLPEEVLMKDAQEVPEEASA